MSEFYTAPILSPSRLPGDLVRMRPTFVPQLAGAAGAWQILYASTNSRGELITASGTVILPDPDTDSRPGGRFTVGVLPGLSRLGWAGGLADARGR